MAVITGTNASDALTGTGVADTISGRGGDDRLSGLASDDALFGEDGDDVLDGGSGDDLLDGGVGVDIASYASLASAIDAESLDLGGGSGLGEWSVSSTAGGSDDLVSIEAVVGTRFADGIAGGDRVADLIRGEAGDDNLRGGSFSAASDTIYGGGGNDYIAGGEEILTFRGDLARSGDRLFGGSGDDRLLGLDGSDALFGEAGNDRLSGGPDRDVLNGGAGRDTFVYLNENRSIGTGTTQGDFGPDLIADFQRGTDRIAFSVARFGFDTDPDVQRLDSFADLDTNRNGVLDGGDRYVDVEPVRHGGATRASTVIDVTDFVLEIPGEQSLTVFGVTGLRAGDLAADALA